jgi:hypothetical protein
MVNLQQPWLQKSHAMQYRAQVALKGSVFIVQGVLHAPALLYQPAPL